MCAPGRSSKGNATTDRPRWRALYGIAALGLAALAVAELAAGAVVRPAVESAVGALAFVAIARWLRRNRAALDQLEWCECAAATLTVRVIASRRPAPVAPAPRAPVGPRVEDGEEARELVLTS